MENAIQLKLFIRSPKGIKPTIEAHRFLDGVETFLNELDNVQKLARNIQSSTRKTLVIGSIKQFAVDEIPVAISTLNRSTHDVQIEIRIETSHEIINAVQVRKFDFGIIDQEPPNHGVVILQKVAIPIVCLIPDGTILSDDPSNLDLITCSGAIEFVLCNNPTWPGMKLIDKSILRKLYNRSRFLAADMSVVVELVRATGVPGIVDANTARIAYEKGGVTIRPIDPVMSYPLTLISSSQDMFNIQAQQLAEALVSRFQLLKSLTFPHLTP